MRNEKKPGLYREFWDKLHENYPSNLNEELRVFLKPYLRPMEEKELERLTERLASKILSKWFNLENILVETLVEKLGSRMIRLDNAVAAGEQGLAEAKSCLEDFQGQVKDAVQRIYDELGDI